MTKIRAIPFFMTKWQKIYNTPCDLRTNQRFKENKITPSATEKTQMEENIVPAPTAEIWEETQPPNILAKKLLNSHTPIIREASFTGASLETMERPIGERHNSPNVWKR